MRIAGGSLRGRPIRSPAGKDIRPTNVRVREALFDILVHGRLALKLSATAVLDAFAGTGALGLEALSRGALHATFMDTDRAAIAALTATVDDLDLGRRATVLRADATNPSRCLGAPTGLLFLDPPYGSGLAEPALIALDAAGWLGPNPIVALEQAAKAPVAPPRGFAVADQRRYGSSQLVLLQRAG